MFRICATENYCASEIWFTARQEYVSLPGTLMHVSLYLEARAAPQRRSIDSQLIYRLDHGRLCNPCNSRQNRLFDIAGDCDSGLDTTDKVVQVFALLSYDRLEAHEVGLVANVTRVTRPTSRHLLQLDVMANIHIISPVHVQLDVISALQQDRHQRLLPSRCTIDLIVASTGGASAPCIDELRITLEPGASCGNGHIAFAFPRRGTSNIYAAHARMSFATELRQVSIRQAQCIIFLYAAYARSNGTLIAMLRSTSLHCRSKQTTEAKSFALSRLIVTSSSSPDPEPNPAEKDRAHPCWIEAHVSSGTVSHVYDGSKSVDAG
ncbi:hypothetical protein KC360_g12 [Hortaea werneckii]|nr:hypothetical protein KC360_g12 [Hortaea werneckii]